MIPRTADLVVVGAGVVGAACAYAAASAGLRVVVLEQGAICSGTSGAGEGNLLVSDKAPGPELELAMLSRRLWGEFAEGESLWEFEPKGGLVVAATTAGAASLSRLAAVQRIAGVEAHEVSRHELRELEPLLSPGLVCGALYPQDAQLQPMLATAHLLRMARERGASVHTGARVTAILRARGAVSGVVTTTGTLSTPAVVNAAGTWAGEVAERAGVSLPILPRRGFVLVTEPLPPRIRHKVYAAEYVGDVASADAGLQTSPVVEGTASGTILIGASRERVGFDRDFSLPVAASLARKAVVLFPFLAAVQVLRSYLGFRPYSPDHLPVIGEDPRLPGLWHACGHEGAGIGLASGTAALVVDAITGAPERMAAAPFSPGRFLAAA